MKKYVVRLTDEERQCCDATIDKLAGSSHKARRARVLRQVAMRTGQTGRTGRSRQRSAAASGRSRTPGGAACCRVSSEPCKGGSAVPRRCHAVGRGAGGAVDRTAAGPAA